MGIASWPSEADGVDSSGIDSGPSGNDSAPRLVVRPRCTYTWDSFLAARPGSVGLDGVVAGPSRQSPTGHRNFNHHEGVDRLSCRATCEQVLLFLGLGLWTRQATMGRGLVDVFVNDADADVSLSVWLFRNRHRVVEAAVQRLVALEGAVDTAGGVWPDYIDDATIGEVAWVFSPYDEAREHVLPTADGPAMAIIIGETGDRISAWADGRGGRVTPTGDFEEIERRGRMVAVREHGPLARTAMRRAGFSAFVAVREAQGATVATIGVLDPAVELDLSRVYSTLNRIEGCGPLDHWGGSDTIVGGSPRMAGTTLSVSTILDVMAEASGPVGAR